MFFTTRQLAIFAVIALACLGASILAARFQRRWMKDLATFMGCAAFIVAGLSALRNLWRMLSSPGIPLGIGRYKPWMTITVDQSPFWYGVCVLAEAGTIVLCGVLAFSVFSYRRD